MRAETISIKRGLDIPIAGVPADVPPEEKQTGRVALLGGDYAGMRPELLVKEGDVVRRGDPLFADKKNPAARYTSPAAGKVTEICRGYRRALVSVVIERTSQQPQKQLKIDASPKPGKSQLRPQQIAALLIESGLWCSFRTRPFSKTPPEFKNPPKAIFVNVMATAPLALAPEVFLRDGDHADRFAAGLRVLAALADCPIYVCHHRDVNPPQTDIKNKNIAYRSFGGKHPAGLSGTHMYFLSPAGRGSTNWWINYQDLAAIGHFFTEGEISDSRYVSLGGPGVKRPRPLIVNQGADLKELLTDELTEDGMRVISGSVLQGHIAEGDAAFLGRYHLQVSALKPGAEREFMGWLSPGLNKFSALNIYISKLFPGKRFALTGTTNGSERAMVPIGMYESVMPQDILPTQLLRSLIVGDIETAEDLGCLELDEEDLALCTFVCPGKYEYGRLLRHNLTRIEKENWEI